MNSTLKTCLIIELISIEPTQWPEELQLFLIDKGVFQRLQEERHLLERSSDREAVKLIQEFLQDVGNQQVIRYFLRRHTNSRIA